MSDHRINEIWSKIKKRSSKHQEDLDIKGRLYINSKYI